ncbi:MAG: polysaccharide biosynthesis tyrosine autokinase [Cyanomargarita calcarea GSE-NOS-MK-12-04C]|jgi:capsular exopolysaccharide synthesis family protein|uniref:Polysaccharide biosynthesis tyrosine autokinase n=1 Tax=Cyanomargarita calcarea GSE-NOS-MK-12-04C TaxID=2839659 RepID=A0A951QP13_9CYAN|nr:polysaccharide biosynthesis tyrosine autokinase [Cyanomargarita calcarea GSE-NOS-MK-12-04C]
MLKSDKYHHPLSQVNTAHLNDVDEGGLNLGKVGAALRRRSLLIAGVTGVVATATVLKAEQAPPEYQGEFEILTKPVTGESQAISNIPQTLGSAPGSVAFPETVQPVKTTIAVLESHRVLNSVVEKLQKKYPELTYNLIAANLTIDSKQDNILKIAYVDQDEKRAIDVLKTLANAFLQYSLAERQADVDQAIKFVNQEIKPIEDRVKLGQNKLRSLRLENKLIDPAQKAQEVSTYIANLTQQQLESRVQLEQMVAKYQNLQRELAQQPGASASNSVLSENANYQRILDQILPLDAEIAKRSSVFTDEEEGMQRLNEQKATMLSLLNLERDRVNRDFQSRIVDLQTRDRSLEQKINNLNNYVKDLATISRNYDNIQRELKINTESLDQFTTKKQALQIEKSQKQQPWQLLDPKLTQVTEPTTVSANAKKNLALGGVLGLLLGVGAALVVDKLSNVFYSSKDLKDATRLPLLGVVPFRKELGTLVAQDLQNASPTSFFEVFRSLYTNILLLGSDSPIRSLVISSAGQGDGKSTVAIQLAQAAAAMGQRVLLVDANLRCPTLHNRVGLMNIQGLTDVISQDLDWNNVIERSPLEDNLYVMSAGPIPPDSVRLLASQKMHDLMDEMQSAFDLVIYDTPPIVGFADAYLLAANTNGMVLVAGLGKLKRTVLQQALEDLQVSGTPILGMVANKSKESVPNSNSYYERYYKQSISAERIEVDAELDASNSSSLRKVKRP